MKRYLLVYNEDYYEIVKEEDLHFGFYGSIPIIIIKLTDELINEIIGVQDETENER